MDGSMDRWIVLCTDLLIVSLIVWFLTPLSTSFQRGHLCILYFSLNVFTEHRLRNNLYQTISSLLPGDKYSRLMLGPVKIPVCTRTLGNRTQRLLVTRPLLSLTNTGTRQNYPCFHGAQFTHYPQNILPKPLAVESCESGLSKSDKVVERYKTYTKLLADRQMKGWEKGGTP